MIEGLWSIQFGSSIGGGGAGVVVLVNGKVLGGDSSYLYIGDYQIAGNEVRTQVKVTHTAGPQNSIFGPLSEFSIDARGRIGESAMQLHGRLVESPNQQITAFCTKKASL